MRCWDFIRLLHGNLGMLLMAQLVHNVSDSA